MMMIEDDLNTQGKQMPVAVPKTAEIKHALTDAIDSDTPLGEFEFARFKRDIERLPEGNARDSMMAYAFAANGQKDKAIQQFEYAISAHGDVVTMHDYCLYCKKIFRNALAYKNAIKFASHMDNPLLVADALTLSFMFYDYETSEFFRNKLDKYHVEGGAFTNGAYAEFDDKRDNLKRMIQQFPFDGSLIAKLAMALFCVAEKHSLPINEMLLMKNENRCVLEGIVACNKPSLLAEINFDVCMWLAEIPNLLECGITGYFIAAPEVDGVELIHAC
jgi:hypothetical protein